MHRTNRSLRPTRLATATAAALACVLLAKRALGDLIVDQPQSQANAFASQDFTDFPAYTCSAFDDVTLAQAHDLTSFVAHGQDSTAEGWMFNADVRLRIFAEPNLTASPLATVSGLQIEGALVWDLTGITLGPGTYWFSAQVVRPFSTGGQWFWRVSDTVNGGHAMWHNPGDGFANGIEPISTELLGSAHHDMAMRLEGTPVPAPAAMVLLLAWGLARRQSRETR